MARNQNAAVAANTTITLTGAQKAAATRAANKAAREAEVQAAEALAKQAQLAQARAEVRAARKAERDAQVAAEQAAMAAEAEIDARNAATKAALDARTAQLAAEREARAAQHAKAHQPEPAAAPIEDMLADFTLPSWKRVAVGIVLGLFTAGTVGYGVGMLAAYALAGIATLTASAGIAFVLSVIVWVLAIYTSWKIGGWIGGKVFASVVLPDGLAARSAASISNTASDVKGWFTTRPVVAATREHAQAFTGAWNAGKPA